MTVEPLEFKVLEMDGEGKKVLFIHGYGGNIEQPGVRWLMRRFRDRGYSVTYIQLPTVIDNFEQDILEPVKEVQDRLGDHVIVSFSLGGLTAAYLKGQKRTVYLSPFWGINDRWSFKGLGTLFRILAGLNRPSLKRQFEKEDAGPMAVDEDMKGIPDYVTPKTISEMHRAQENMPEPDGNDIIFYCPKDSVISISNIEAKDLEKYRFNGGHMFYLSRERDEIMEKVISCIEEGFAQTHSAT